jgi:hypothetical protein
VAYTEHDVHYALETTRILREPDRRIDTFGTTQFEFVLISELMDRVDRVRVREGKIQAERPMVLRPEGMSEFAFDGFGDGADAFKDWLAQRAGKIAVLQYGFTFKKSDVKEELVHGKLAEVEGRIAEEVENGHHPGRAVLSGVDDTWEICLLRFTVDMILKSANINLFDLKRRGII